MLPEFEIDHEHAGADPATVLRPLFDLVWNAFGQRGSPNYDHTGTYVSR